MKPKISGNFMRAMRLRKTITNCAGLIWGAGLFLMTAATAAADEIRQRQAVGDIEIVLAVPHAEESTEGRTESQNEHHLVIWLFERGTSKSIEGAQVKANVAQAGYAGSEKMLRRMMADGKSAYSGSFMMPGRFEYRIKVQIRRPGESRVIEAHFEYRHHHELK